MQIDSLELTINRDDTRKMLKEGERVDRVLCGECHPACGLVWCALHVIDCMQFLVLCLQKRCGDQQNPCDGQSLVLEK
jgi:hypothetical protein